MVHYETGKNVKTKSDLQNLVISGISRRGKYFTKDDIVNFVIFNLQENLLAFRREVISSIVCTTLDALEFIGDNIGYDNKKGCYKAHLPHLADDELTGIREHVEKYPELFYKEKRKSSKMIRSDEDLEQLIIFTILDRQKLSFTIEDIVDIVKSKLCGSEFEEYIGLVELTTSQIIAFYCSDNHPYELRYYEDSNSYSFNHWYDGYDDPELISIKKAREEKSKLLQRKKNPA